MSLHELVYVSLAEHPMTEEELRVLLDQARDHNRAHGITGLLIYHDREFMQLIEGERSEVEALFDLIEFDPRHQQVYRMWDGPIAARSCQDWAMGYAAPHADVWHALPGGQQVLDEGLFTVGCSSAGKRLLAWLRDELLHCPHADLA